MTITKERPSAVNVHANEIIEIMREFGSVTREYITQHCHVGSKSAVDSIIREAVRLGRGAVLEKRNCLVWIPDAFTDTDASAEQEADRAKRRGEGLT